MDKFLKRKVDEPKGDSVDEANSSGLSKKQRKYDTDYIAYGFIAAGPNADQLQCVVCLQTLSNEAMKPAKLSRHLKTVHPDLATKPKEYFERQKDQYLKQKGNMKACATVSEKCLRASYLVALRIAKAKKPHTIAEQLILRAAIDICDAALGKECSTKLKSIPLSDNTVNRRICDMSEDKDADD